MNAKQRPDWLNYVVVLLTPIIGMALGVGVMFLLGLNQTDFGDLIVNLFFLVSVIVLVYLFEFSSEDLGLKVIREQLRSHVILSLTIFAFYMLFYLFVIRISALKPFSASTFWGLINYLFVVFAEELYFRGALYTFFEKRFSAKAALISSSILFGLLHAQQGIIGMISKVFAGWLWGSVRYSTGMIFLLIFPVHFIYNSIWLLFEGNWNNQPDWVIYIVSAIEFALGLAIVMMHNKKSEKA